MLDHPELCGQNQVSETETSERPADALEPWTYNVIYKILKGRQKQDDHKRRDCGVNAER